MSSYHCYSPTTRGRVPYLSEPCDESSLHVECFLKLPSSFGSAFVWLRPVQHELHYLLLHYGTAAPFLAEELYCLSLRYLIGEEIFGNFSRRARTLSCNILFCSSLYCMSPNGDYLITDSGYACYRFGDYLMAPYPDRQRGPFGVLLIKPHSAPLLVTDSGNDFPHLQLFESAANMLPTHTSEQLKLR